MFHFHNFTVIFILAPFFIHYFYLTIFVLKKIIIIILLNTCFGFQNYSW